MSNFNSSPKFTFYFVRHAENIGMIDKFAYEPDKDILTQNGHKQAELLGKMLKDEKITKCYASDYKRCVQTAEIILENNENKNENSKIPVVLKEELRELNLGCFFNKPYSELFGKINSLEIPLDKWTIPDGENSDVVHKRSQKFMEDLLIELEEKGESERILIVSHGFLLRCIMEYFKNHENPLNWKPRCSMLVGNSVFSKVTVEPRTTPGGGEKGKRKVFWERVADSSHLPEENIDQLVQLVKTPMGKRFEPCVQT